MRSRLSFWSRRPAASRGGAAPPTWKREGRARDYVKHVHFLNPHIHTPRKAPDGLYVFLQPSRLPAHVIRQVTTVRVLDAGQQRRSRWQVEPETLAPSLCCLLVLKLLLPLTHSKKEQEYWVMVRKEEWAKIVDWNLQNKYFLVDSAMRWMKKCS